LCLLQGPAEDDADDMDILDGGDDEVDFKYNCNQVRNKINAFLRSGEMKV